MLRPCLALVSYSCLHSAALSVLACTPRAYRVTESPRLTLQLGSNHTVPEPIRFGLPAYRATNRKRWRSTAPQAGPAVRLALQPSEVGRVVDTG